MYQIHVMPEYVITSDQASSRTSKYAPNFAGSKKGKVYKAINIFSMSVLVLNMTLGTAFMGVFFVAPGEALACHGDITIIKNTGGISSPDFDFSGTGGSGAPGDFTIAGGEQWNDSWIEGDVVYTFEEINIPSGWKFKQIECSGGDTTITGQKVKIDLNDGDDVVCTFYNEKEDDECELELLKTDSPDPVVPGGELTYTLTLTNTGTTDCTGSGVELREIYNDLTTFVSSDPNPTSGDNIWVKDVIAPGESYVVDILTTVSSEAECESEIVNEACAWAEQSGSKDDEDNWVCATAITTIDCPNPSCGDGTQDPGEECDDENNDDGDGCSANCTIEPLTIKAYKVVCDDETDLPDWHGGDISITPSLINQYLTDNEGCYYVQEEWNFQYGDHNINSSYNGDYTGHVSETGWDNFSTSSNYDQPATLELDLDSLSGKVWFREVLKPGYIPFSYPPGSAPGANTSAEFYCGTDVLNYDNMEWIESSEMESGGIYYCVAFNALTPPPPSELIVIKEVVGGSAVSSDWTMEIVDVDTFPGSSGGTAREVTGGNMYQVLESGGLSDYILTYSSDCGDTGLVSVPVGETKTCILTNTYSPPPGPGSITACKYEDADGLASTTGDRTLIIDTAWTFTIGSVSQDTVEGCTTFIDLDADDYTIIETQQTNWTAVDPASGELTVSLAAEEQKTVKFANSYNPPLPICGDGVVNQSWEQCDDGNSIDGDGCSAACTNEGGGGGGGGGRIFLQIVELKAECVTEDTAIINWRTNKETTSWIVYGIDSNDMSDATSTETTSASTNHSVTVSGLVPETEYKFEAVAFEGSRATKLTTTYNTNDCVETKGEEGEPILTIEKVITEEQEFYNAGDTEIEYILTYSNIGNLTAFNTVITDVLPEGLTYTDIEGNSRQWEVGDLAPGETGQISYLVNVEETADPKIYVNIATIGAENFETLEAMEDTEVREVIVLAETGFSVFEFITLLLAVSGLVGASSLVKRASYNA